MTRRGVVLGAVALVLGWPAVAAGQAGSDAVVLNGATTQWLVDTAVLAAPPALRDAAEVRGWTADGRVVTLRDGDGLICLADRPGDGRFAAACYHRGLEAFMARGRELLRQDIRGEERNQVRWAEIEAGTIVMPDRGMVYNLGYATEDIDPATFDPATGQRLHALYIPGATMATTGLTTQPGDGPWLMFAGTPSAHLMIGIPPREPPEG
ncbi:MAG: hypothetical protein R3314_03885 [Longimicrobiales bacterium]|nr:hypothetical protein [Longimicrobiales bacterium]